MLDADSFNCFVFDLDNTLLNEDRAVSMRTLNAIRCCVEQDKNIFLASVRPPGAIEDIGFPADLYARFWKIAYNGALALDPENRKVFHRPLSYEMAKEVFTYLVDRNPNPTIVWGIEKRVYCNCELTSEERRILGIPVDSPSLPILPFLEQPGSFQRGEFIPASKVVVVNPLGTSDLLQAFGSRANIVITDDGQLLHIMDKQASKDVAVIDVLNHLSIPIDRVMVFGDDTNDLGLFKVLPYSVAMANAIPQIRDIAWHTTLSNREDGVATILERLFAS